METKAFYLALWKKKWWIRKEPQILDTFVEVNGAEIFSHVFGAFCLLRRNVRNSFNVWKP